MTEFDDFDEHPETGIFISSSEVDYSAGRPDCFLYATNMTLKFVTKSGSTATLGSFLPLTLRDLRRYTRMYPIHWMVL